MHRKREVTGDKTYISKSDLIRKAMSESPLKRDQKVIVTNKDGSKSKGIIELVSGEFKSINSENDIENILKNFHYIYRVNGEYYIESDVKSDEVVKKRKLII